MPELDRRKGGHRRRDDDQTQRGTTEARHPLRLSLDQDVGSRHGRGELLDIERSRGPVDPDARCDVPRLTGAEAGAFGQLAPSCIEPAVLYGRMFTARAATRSTVTAESVDSAAINAFAGRVRGMASVGLNAVAFVSDM